MNCSRRSKLIMWDALELFPSSNVTTARNHQVLRCEFCPWVWDVMEKKKLFLHCLSSSHCGSCQIKNTVIYLYISPHEISIISSWYPHSQCVFTSSGPFQHWEPRAVWVVEVVLRRISATWRAWVSSLGDDELKLGWFGMKGGGKKMENMDTWTWYYVQWWFISFLYPNGWLP
jgi:hypothetical protein